MATASSTYLPIDTRPELGHHLDDGTLVRGVFAFTPILG
jgi:hypothetical protein